MLTTHNYRPLEVDLEKGTIYDCCKKETQDDPNCTDCCYDTWRDSLKKVNQTYVAAKEKADQLQVKLTYLTDRRDRFKTWLTELDKAEDYARKICYQLEILAVQSDKIWYNTHKATLAIEILFCMIRDFYMQVDYIKKRYDDLQTCINKNSDPSLIKGQGLLKCLEEYSIKLDLVIKTRDEIIVAVLNAIKLANLIRNSISTGEVPDDYNPCAPVQKPCHVKTNEYSYYGFKTVIREWFDAFECDVPCEEENASNQNPYAQKQSSGQIQEQKPEAESCELVPIFDFPLCRDKYKIKIQDWYNSDNTVVKNLGGELKEANMQKESLLACRQSLVKAIVEVDPKTRCQV